MPTFCQCVVMGHLTKEPDYRSTQSGSSVCELSVAFNRHGRNGQTETTYLKVSVWGKPADNCHKYLSKGSLVHVAGYLKQERWQDRNGSNRSEIKLVAEQIQFMPSGRSRQQEDKSQEAEYSGVNPEYGPERQQPTNNTAQHQPRFYGDTGVSYQAPVAASVPADIQDEEVPF